MSRVPELQYIRDSLERRQLFFKQMDREGTNCYRLFHGITEGLPGLTVDRYGSQIIMQSFRSAYKKQVAAEIFELIRENFDIEFSFFYNHRDGKNSCCILDIQRENREEYCLEQGIKFVSEGYHGGLDPLLFLDLRVGRRYLNRIAKGKSVLNLFAYTCTAGISALRGGATEVLNVDFSSKWLSYGKQNLLLNSYDHRDMDFIKEDFFPITRQLSGLGMKGRVRKVKYTRVEARKFDILLLDPPTYTKSKFFTVDIVRDYQALFKPSILSLKNGGTIICTNHSPKVEKDEWLENLFGCCSKSGYKMELLDFLEPDSDFPSFDGKHPLKIAVCKIYE